MIREHRGSLKVEERLEGAVWVLRFKTTRDCDHKRVERTRVIGAGKRLSHRSASFCRSGAPTLVHRRAGIKTWNSDLRNSCRILSARVEEGTGIEEAQAESTFRTKKTWRIRRWTKSAG